VKIAEIQSGADGQTLDFTFALYFLALLLFLPPRLEDESKISLNVSEMY